MYAEQHLRIYPRWPAQPNLLFIIRSTQATLKFDAVLFSSCLTLFGSSTSQSNLQWYGDLIASKSTYFIGHLEDLCEGIHIGVHGLQCVALLGRLHQCNGVASAQDVVL